MEVTGRRSQKSSVKCNTDIPLRDQEVTGRRSLKSSVKSDTDIKLCELEMTRSGSQTSSVKRYTDISLCQICECDGTEVYAHCYCKTCHKHLCTSCLQYHQCLQRNNRHVIKNKENQISNKVHDEGSFKFCDIHETEIVKLYCQRHNSVGCEQCMNLYHKKYLGCMVQPIADVSRNYDNSRELAKIKEELNNLMSEIISSRHEVLSSLNDAEKLKETQVDKVKTFHAELKQYINASEEEILQKVEQIHANDVKYQTELCNQCETIATEINKYQEQLDQSSVEAHNLFATAKLAHKKLCSFRDSIEDVVVSKTKISTYKFVPSSDLPTIKEKLGPLGTLDIDNKDSEECDFSKSELVGKVNVQMEVEDDCCITGMVMISGDEILLADNANSSLKIYNINENMVTSMCKSFAKPFDVTTITFETAAATLPTVGEILFLNTKNGLTLDRTLRVRKNCRGIDHSNGLLAVTFTSPPTVQVLNLNGKILHQIQDTETFQLPGSVVFTNDSTCLLVSDFGKNTVYKLEINDNLTVHSEFKNLNRPSGLVLAKSNTAIVCCTGDNERLSMINIREKDVQFLNTNHVQKPVSITISKGHDYMYICENKGAVDSNYIIVYHLE
ncbi:uncharacterized protein LOC132757896 [Ruditapes philippinarum]|uniref:uncharacterized protein LOC132757896 n=1 Tax=Ruditapes philippinarum TaxID=129788 RepID=UPI00295BF493|nr:uncharacterized protein LOC132757896 [Ruditapes philippinarum]